jgi:hypothetical protein
LHLSEQPEDALGSHTLVLVAPYILW